MEETFVESEVTQTTEVSTTETSDVFSSDASSSLSDDGFFWGNLLEQVTCGPNSLGNRLLEKVGLDCDGATRCVWGLSLGLLFGHCIGAGEGSLVTWALMKKK